MIKIGTFFFLSRTVCTTYLPLQVELNLSKLFPWMFGTYRMEEMCFESRVRTHHLKFIYFDFSVSCAKENKGASALPSHAPPTTGPTGLPTLPCGNLRVGVLRPQKTPGVCFSLSAAEIRIT